MTRGKQSQLALLGCVSMLLVAQLATSTRANASGSGTPGPMATTPFTGFDPSLARAPYVTDLTQSSAQVTWATTSSSSGSLRYGPVNSCAQTLAAVSSTTQLTVSPAGTATRTDYQSSVTLSGLAPGTTYCYAVYGPGSPGSNLLPPARPSQTFTTLDPVSISSTTPLTFDVVADFGETMNRGAPYDPTANPVNTNQSAIDSLIGSSGARFVVGVGDIAYNDGSPSNYGDLEEVGTDTGCSAHPSAASCEVSNIFGASYWPLTGGIPMFAAIGNHGQNSLTGVQTWPESASASEPGEVYGSQTYSGVDGISTASYPSAWYAFSSGNARFYVLDASWNDCGGCNFGTAAGSQCPDEPAGSPNCKGYQVDADTHFAPNSPEYTWLAGDLHAHPGGLKFAFWHYPLRSDNATQDSDVYLQSALEPLLAQNGVDVVFNGHAHDYERNATAGPNTVISYVTGGGGGIVSPVAGHAGNPCGAWDAYAIGWDYTAGSGSHCGSIAASPTSDAQVYNFLRVSVNSSQVTVTPVNATNQQFDQQTYTFTPPTPSAPGNVTAGATSATTVQLTWSASTETGDYVSSYRIARNGVAVASVPASQTSYMDTGLQPNTTATYTVTAVDGAGNPSPPGTSNQVTTPLFSTDFETGSLSGWSRVSGNVSVQTQFAHSISHAAALTATSGQPPGSYAFQNLPAASTNLYAQGWAYLPNPSTTATLLGVRAAAQVAQVYVSNGVIKVLDNVSHASYLSSTSFAVGSWHAVTLQVNEGAGTMEVWLDGTPVPFTTPSGKVTVITGQNFTPSGASAPLPMNVLQLGDDSTNRTYQWYADDLIASTVQPGTSAAPSVPTAPSSVVATPVSASSVQVKWAASSEPGGTIASYQVSRNGAQIASVQAPSTAYTDSALQPGASATYSVTAIDANGTSSATGTSNSVTTPLFTSGFEAGTCGGALTGWTKVVNVAVQGQTFHPGTGACAAALNAASGTQSFATQDMPSSSTALYAQGWVYVASHSTIVTLFGLRTPTAQVARVFLQPNGAFSVANNVDPGHPSYLGNLSFATGSWHEVTFAVDETAGTMKVWLDGTAVTFNTSTGSISGQNLGSTPMTNFQIGDDSTQHAYSWYADDLTVSTVQPAF